MLWLLLVQAVSPLPTVQLPKVRTQKAVVRSQPATDPAINAMLDRSEWDPAKYLSLNLRTGRYTIIQRVTPKDRPRRPLVPFREGVLTRSQRGKIMPAFRAAVIAGLVKRNCRAQDMVISNAGPISLQLTSQSHRFVSLTELGCWTDEAIFLQDVLSDEFW